MDKIDPNKKYKTRAGREVVKIVPVDFNPIFKHYKWKVYLANGVEFFVTEFGLFHTPDDIERGHPLATRWDLIEEPQAKQEPPEPEREAHTFYCITMRTKNKEIIQISFTTLKGAQNYKEEIERRHALPVNHFDYYEWYSVEIHEIELEVLV